MFAVDARDSLQRLQNEVLEAVARGRSLDSIAELLCLRAQFLATEAVCSILAVDGDLRLHPLAAPGLPASYSAAIEGLQAGPLAGSCGTAAWLGEPVEVQDIATDPRWADYRDLALPLGLRACWSSPIKAGDGRVVGAFAFYYRTVRGPSEYDRKLVEACVHLCAIAIEQEEAKRKVRRLAFQDALTGLANRADVHRRLAELLSDVSAPAAVNLLYVDLDDFKGVNDTLGHQIGDQILAEVAIRLRACAADAALIGRLGGDEFVLAQIAREDPAREGAALAQRVIAAISKRYVLDEGPIEIGASVGVAQAPRDGDNVALLCKRADLALYDAKSAGGGVARFYSPELERPIIARRSLQRDLRSAVANGDFNLAYQPIYSLGDGALIGAEALLRWSHPAHGEVAPLVFIPLIEEMKLMEPLGDWTLRAACAEAARWPANIKLSVNFSPLQLRKPGFALDLARTLSNARMRPERLDLDVSENALRVDEMKTRHLFGQLRDFGVDLSLDDFGAGHSSLRSLNAFPFNNVKIDKSFVRDLDRPDACAVVRAIISLARDLGMTVTAEGVETEEQRGWLRANGCDRAQGFLLGAPRPAAELPNLFGPRRGLAIAAL